MKDNLQSILIFVLLGLILFGIVRNYTKTSEITVSRANVIIERPIEVQITVLPQPSPSLTNEPSYWFPLEAGTDWSSR